MEMNALMMNQKHKRKNLLKKKSHFWINFLCGSGNIRALFLIKEEPVKAKKGKIKIQSDSEKRVLNSSILSEVP